MIVRHLRRADVPTYGDAPIHRGRRRNDAERNDAAYRLWSSFSRDPGDVCTTPSVTSLTTVDLRAQGAFTARGSRDDLVGTR